MCVLLAKTWYNTASKNQTIASMGRLYIYIFHASVNIWLFMFYGKIYHAFSVHSYGFPCSGKDTGLVPMGWNPWDSGTGGGNPTTSGPVLFQLWVPRPMDSCCEAVGRWCRQLAGCVATTGGWVRFEFRRCFPFEAALVPFLYIYIKIWENKKNRVLMI